MRIPISALASSSTSSSAGFNSVTSSGQLCLVASIVFSLGGLLECMLPGGGPAPALPDGLSHERWTLGRRQRRVRARLFCGGEDDVDRWRAKAFHAVESNCSL